MTGLKLGLMLQPAALSGAGGGGGAVSLSAVRMHLDYSLKYAAGKIASSPRGFMSSWTRGSVGSVANRTPQNNINMFNKYVYGQHKTGVADAESEPGANFTFDAAGLRLNLGTTAPSPMNAVGDQNVNCAWIHRLWMWDTNFSSGNKHMGFALNGVQVAASITGDGVGASNVALADSDFWLNLSIGGYQGSSIFDCAQFIMDNSDVSAWLTGNGTFAANVISKFCSPAGVPVADTADGSNFTPDGLSPAIYHAGDKTTFGTNRGTRGAAGNPVVFANQTARGFAANYMFGPGAVADRPYEVGTVYEANPATFPAESAGATGFSGFNFFGTPIALGDTLFLIVNLTNNGSSSGSSRNLTMNKGWTNVTSLFVTGNNGGDFAIFRKVAANDGNGNDTTAAGSDWTNAPTLTWTVKGVAFVGAGYNLTSWRGPGGAAVTATALGAQCTGTIASGYATPSITAPSGKSVLVTGVANGNIPGEPIMGPPTGENILFCPYQGPQSIIMMAWEPLNAAGATGNKPWTADGNSSQAFSVGYQMVLS